MTPLLSCLATLTKTRFQSVVTIMSDRSLSSRFDGKLTWNPAPFKNIRWTLEEKRIWAKHVERAILKGQSFR